MSDYDNSVSNGQAHCRMIEEPSDLRTGAEPRNKLDRESTPEDVGKSYDSLTEEFGQGPVDKAFADNAGTQFTEDLIDQIEKTDDIPVPMKSAMIDELKTLMASTGGNAGSDVAEAVQDQTGGLVDDMSSTIMEDLIKAIQDQTKELMAPGSSGGKATNGGEGKGGAGAAGGKGKGGGGGAEGAGAGGGAEGAGAGGGAEGAGAGGGAEGAAKGGGADGAGEGARTASEAAGPAGSGGAEAQGSGGSGGGENWLVALAKAMGEVSGKFLEKQVETGKKLGAMGGSEGNEGEFAELNAEMQAAAQMFKIAQEALATVVKTAGEGMVSVARK